MAMALPSMLVWAVSSAAMAYVYYGVMKLPRGAIRLAAALPLIAFYVSAADGFQTVSERAFYPFFFLWVTLFKIVLLCWDEGPAADPWAVASFPRFLAVMNLSIQIQRQKFSDRSRKENISTSTNEKKNLKADDSSSASPSVVRAESSSATGHTSGRGADVDAKGNGHASSSEAPVAQGWIAPLKRVDESQELPMVVLRLLFKFMRLMAMTYAAPFTPKVLMPLYYFFHMYISVSLVFEGITALVSPLMGIEFEPCFNKPFLAHSLADFWGKRWNLLVSNLMRVSVYDPVVRFLLWCSETRGSSSAAQASKSMGLAPGSTRLGPLRPSPGTTTATAASSAPRLPLWVRSTSMFSCFLVSGLMHELIFHNMTRRKPSGEVTFFFILNGAALLLEGALRRKTSLRLPKWVSMPLTFSFIFVTANGFLFPPLIESGAADRSIAENRYFFDTLLSLTRGIVTQTRTRIPSPRL